MNGKKNACLMWVTKVGIKENGREKLFKERIAGNFPEFMTDVNLQI